MSARAKPALPDPDESVLPPGQRDRSGFWLPVGYDDPRTLVRRRRRRAADVAVVEDEPEPAGA